MKNPKRPNRYVRLKRALDIVGAVTLLSALSPLLLIVSVLVRFKLGQPIIFRQVRPGMNGESFTLYKYRTMLNIDETAGLVSNDERMTSFGRRLRSTSLDELPSLVNVLRGEMSFVGPRPLLVEYLERYTPIQKRRHEVRPGITGLAQINGRNMLDWEARFALDVEYVENVSFYLDLKILIRTLWTAVSRKGIASEGHVVGAPFLGETTLSESGSDLARSANDD